MHETNHQPEYLLQKLGEHGLDQEVKGRIRVALSSYADFHTAGGRAPVKKAGLFGWLTTAHGYVPTAALLMFALLAGGTAYASEDSLPGEALYAVKIRVTEPVAVALATTPEKKAVVHTELAERRLEEAAKLAVRQTLTAETAAVLEQKFSEHVDGSLAAADTLIAEGKTDAALDVRSDLEARLVAHGDILNLVENHLAAAGAPVHDATQSVLATVKLRQEVVTETRVALERDIAKEATPTETLALVTKASEAVPADASATLAAPFAEHVTEAGEALTEAKEALDSGGSGTDRAFRKVKESERASDIVETLLENSEIIASIAPVGTTTPTTTPAATTTPSE